MEPIFTSKRSRTPSVRHELPWQWPSDDACSQSPDRRLLCPELPDLQARIFFPDESVVSADVRSVSQHDIVLKVPTLEQVPVRGQIVEVSISNGSETVLDSQKAVLHWSGIVSRRAIVALFTITSTGETLSRWIENDVRGDIRYPVKLPITIKTAEDRDVFGTIVDYSLGGCGIVCNELLALDCEYRTTIQMNGACVDVAMRPMWSSRSGENYQLGCTFRSEEGVLLACRHHRTSNGLTRPMRPLTSDWNPPQHNDSSAY